MPWSDLPLGAQAVVLEGKVVVLADAIEHGGACMPEHAKAGELAAHRAGELAIAAFAAGDVEIAAEIAGRAR